MKKKVLFIDRDGVLIKEFPPTYQIDSFTKLEFYPHVFEYLRKIASECNYDLVMVSNQDGLGTESFPEETFLPIHEFIIKSLENEDIHFSAVHIDRTFPEEKASTRKPGIGMLGNYLSDEYDMPGSFVIGDRVTDMELAENLGCKGIWLKNDPLLGSDEPGRGGACLRPDSDKGGGKPRPYSSSSIVLETTSWKEIYEFLRLPQRIIQHERETKETFISIKLNLDGSGKADIKTGLAFFDHMLEQVSRHGGIDLSIECKGDLHIDEHHTIEDTGIALGEAFSLALADKRGIERYGFLLPMDDCLAQVAIDFGGRPWLVWQAEFLREKVGDMPTEMFHHFFKSFSDAAKCNLNIKVEGSNEHHKIESIFKAFARAISMAVKREIGNDQLPSTKGVL